MHTNVSSRHFSGLVALCGLLLVVFSCGRSGELPLEKEEAFRGLFQKGLEAPDAHLRAETVRVLGRVGSPSLQSLVEGAVKDRSTLVSLGASTELFRGGSRSAVSEMARALSNGDPRVRRTIAREVLAPGTPKEGREELTLLMLRSKDPELRLRGLRFGVLKRIESKDELDRETRKLLGELVQGGDPLTAGIALRALRAVGRKDLLDRFVNQVDRSKTPLAKRRRAVQVLGEAHLPETRETLKKIFDAVSEETLRADLAIALFGMGDHAMIDEVRASLRGASSERKTYALRALGRSQEEDALRIARTHRVDSDPNVRALAYKAMAAHPRVEPRDFGPGLEDEEQWVASTAMSSMLSVRAGGVPVLLGEILSSSDRSAGAIRVLLSSLEVLEKEHEEGLRGHLENHLLGLEEVLLPLLVHKNPRVRGGAAELLFQREDPMTLYRRLGDAYPEATYALLERMLQVPGKKPLQHLEFLEGLLDHRLLSVRIMAAACIWRAYLQERKS